MFVLQLVQGPRCAVVPWTSEAVGGRLAGPRQLMATTLVRPLETVHKYSTVGTRTSTLYFPTSYSS